MAKADAEPASKPVDRMEEVFLTHVVGKWMGNRPKVAQKHSLQETDTHFENPVQQSAARSGTPSQAGEADTKKPLRNQNSQGLSGTQINPTRSRTVSESTEETACFIESGAESGAFEISWSKVRQMILACPELGKAEKEDLIRIGDANADPPLNVTSPEQNC